MCDVEMTIESDINHETQYHIHVKNEEMDLPSSS